MGNLIKKQVTPQKLESSTDLGGGINYIAPNPNGT
jgi:hypothetical protein